MFKVFRTDEFEKLVRKLSKGEQERLGLIEEAIAQSGFTGDPLGFKFLREKRMGGRRVYFLVYEDMKAALMVSVSDKKTQQQTIERIKDFLPEFRKLMQEFIGKPT